MTCQQLTGYINTREKISYFFTYVVTAFLRAGNPRRSLCDERQYWTPFSSPLTKRLLKFAVKRSPKNSSSKAICKVRLFYFIKISCLRLLWLGPSDRFATKRHLFLTVSWRLLVFNVLGNVTNSLLLCGAMRDVNEICKSRSTTLFILTPTIYCLTMKPSKIIWTSVVFHQDTYWEAESNQLRTIRES